MCISWNSVGLTTVEMLLNCVIAACDLLNSFCGIALLLWFSVPFIYLKVTFQWHKEVGDLEWWMFEKMVDEVRTGMGSTCGCFGICFKILNVVVDSCNFPFTLEIFFIPTNMFGNRGMKFHSTMLSNGLMLLYYARFSFSHWRKVVA